jgi:hypothetical protein
MGRVNHGYAWGLARRFMGSKGMRMGGIYLMTIEEYKWGKLFVMEGN